MIAIYAGVGSRNTPSNILNEMQNIAFYLGKIGWTLRSGGADGADSAFEKGCDRTNGKKEIFLPWKNFNKSNSELCSPSKEAIEIAKTIHPAWENLSQGAKLLHARNCHQVLGVDLKTPANLLICWTENGRTIGGTATAIKIAKNNGIKVINLATENIDLGDFKNDTNSI